MQEEIKKLRDNLDKLEQLTSKLRFMLKEINQIVGDKDGQNRSTTDSSAVSNSN